MRLGAFQTRKSALSGADVSSGAQVLAINIVTRRFCVNPGEGDEISYLHEPVDLTAKRIDTGFFSGGSLSRILRGRRDHLRLK